MPQYQICTRCVMDTTDSQIGFDSTGVCNHCHDYEISLKNQQDSSNQMRGWFEGIVSKIKKAGLKNEYDCIVGLSGGVDSSYLLWVLVEEFSLRPLVVHLDNGWNSKLAVNNIQKLIRKLDVDLYTHVIKWEEFKDLQRAYFKASVLDIEVATDHAITAVLYKVAIENNIKYILMGTNRATERIIPKSWSFNKNDIKNLLSIHRKFGTVCLTTYPLLGLAKQWYCKIFKRIEVVSPLDYLNYNKDDAKAFLKETLRWEDYGGKHHESIFTRFYQGYILPKKFGIDKRRAHFSSLINAGYMNRKKAIEELNMPPYPLEHQQEDYDYVRKKLDFSEEEFEEIMVDTIRSHFNFSTDIWSKINRKILNPNSKLRHILVKIYYRQKV